MVRSRGRGVGHGKNVRISNNYEEGSRLQFTPTNRGRSKRPDRPSQHFYPSKQVPNEDIHVIAEQISALDIEPKKLSTLDKLQYGKDFFLVLRHFYYFSILVVKLSFIRHRHLLRVYLQ